jgi:cytochrome c peroxidase
MGKPAALLPAVTWLLLSTTAYAGCPGYSVCPAVNYPKILHTDVKALANLAAIDATEAATLKALNSADPASPALRNLLGQALIFDRNLSARRNEACALCHTPAAGFADGISAFTPAGGVFPGSVTTRAGLRTPPSLAYSEFAPLLQYTPATKAKPAGFNGGLFWDMRAAGLATGDPGTDQGAFPIVNPLELALPDPACLVRRIAQAPYAAAFRAVWGDQSLQVTFPANTDAVCATPNNGGATQAPLKLSAGDRVQVAQTVQLFGQNIEEYGQSKLASPFTSKYDAVRAGRATFTDAEAAGLALFTGRAHCSQCHGFTLPEGVPTPPLFTDFSAHNDGIPRNPKLPYLTENTPDAAGYVANPAGPAFIDQGLGGFLQSAADTNPSFKSHAQDFIGTFQEPTLRNVAALPYPGATRTYMHNGYFSSLALIVHFYNTRDALPRCTGTTGIGITCWPAPEVAANENHVIGNLGLSAAEEAEIVDFLGTLTDGYAP